MITLVDGHKLVVSETVEELVGRIRSWRAGVAAAAYRAATDAELIQDGIDLLDPLGPRSCAEAGADQDDAGDPASHKDYPRSAARRADRTERLAVVAGLGRVLPIARKEG